MFQTNLDAEIIAIGGVTLLCGRQPRFFAGHRPPFVAGRDLPFVAGRDLGGFFCGEPPQEQWMPHRG